MKNTRETGEERTEKGRRESEVGREEEERRKVLKEKVHEPLFRIFAGSGSREKPKCMMSDEDGDTESVIQRDERET